jgi:hypothetical protein
MVWFFLSEKKTAGAIPAVRAQMKRRCDPTQKPQDELRLRLDGERG